jgi:hypothetical protein
MMTLLLLMFMLLQAPMVLPLLLFMLLLAPMLLQVICSLVALLLLTFIMLPLSILLLAPTLLQVFLLLIALFSYMMLRHDALVIAGSSLCPCQKCLGPGASRSRNGLSGMKNVKGLIPGTETFQHGNVKCLPGNRRLSSMGL